MADKKLYECRFEMVYYALAASPVEANRLAKEALEDIYGEDEMTRATEVTHADWPLKQDWDESSLVYGKTHGDTTLGMLLNILPPKS